MSRHPKRYLVDVLIRDRMTNEVHHELLKTDELRDVEDVLDAAWGWAEGSPPDPNAEPTERQLQRMMEGGGGEDELRHQQSEAKKLK